MKKLFFLLLCVYYVCSLNVAGQRKFKHPGILYTQADIDRMKAMVAAKREPYYTGFQELKNDQFTVYRDLDLLLAEIKGKEILWKDCGRFFELFGRIAFNNALMWKLTGEKSYADKTVTILNQFIPVRSTILECLTNGSALRLIEAAELMRDYEGWDPDDQQRFKDFLVHPGYSSKVDYFKLYSSWDTTKNNVSVYWNIYNGDSGRHGNQGMYGLRTLMAMGIYLDNDTIYDRAYRKLLSLPHRSDDLPYPKGPKIPHGSIPHVNERYYVLHDKITCGDIDDWGYDDELKYWIYAENGQSQEASRDQGHPMDGFCNIIDIARTAWNQGDDMCSAYDGLILKGITFAAKYNYGYYNKVIKNNAYWYEDELFEPTIENGQFISRTARCGRWTGLAINPWRENNDTVMSRGKLYHSPENMYMHYKIRMGLPDDSILWVKRAYELKKIEDKKIPGGLLTYRTVWMAGDGGKFVNGEHQSGLPAMPGCIKAVDYDYYSKSKSGEGFTYHNNDTNVSDVYRNEGCVEIEEDENGDYFVTDMQDGEWMNYTFTVGRSGYYKIIVDTEVSKEGGALYASIDNGSVIGGSLAVTNGFQKQELGMYRLDAGASVLRISVGGVDNAVRLRSIEMEEVGLPQGVVDYMWDARDYKPVSGEGNFLTESNSLLVSCNYMSDILPVFTVSSTPMSYRVSSEKLYMAVHGRKLNMIVFKGTSYRLPGQTEDVVKNSASGQASTWSVRECGRLGDEQLFVWQLDSSSNRRIEPLLGECYEDGVDGYTLTHLNFSVNGEYLYKDTEIDDIGFYTLDELMERYGEELKDMPLGVSSTIMRTGTNHSVYRLDGTCVSVDTSKKGGRNSLPKGIYIIDGKKVVCP